MIYLTNHANWAATTNDIIHPFSDILFGLKSASNRIYPALAAQGLTLSARGSTLDVRFWHLKSILHTGRVNIFIMTVDLEHRYSNRSERDNQDIYDDFKLKKNPLVSTIIKKCFNPLPAKLFNLNFHTLEVVSRWRDPQLQVSENYSDLLVVVTFYL